MSSSFDRDVRSTEVLILYAPVGGGHYAAARALAEAAVRAGLTPRLVDIFGFVGPFWRDAYMGLHVGGQTMAPELYGALYHAADQPHDPWAPTRRRVERHALRRLRAYVCALRPRLVLATHHLGLAALASARDAGQLPFLAGVVTDYTAHVYWADPAVDLYFVPRGLAGKDLTRCGTLRHRVVATGIPVAGAFAAVSPWRAPRDGEPLRVLLTAGGLGVGPVLDVVRSFARARGRGEAAAFDLRVLCGRDARLRERVSRLAVRYGISLEAIGFSEEMPSHMDWAHVVAGKAGGLTVTEALTAGRPLVLCGAIPGNESANASYVVGGGAGVTAVPSEVARVLQALRAPSVDSRGASTSLRAMAHAARQLVTPAAADDIVRLAQGAAFGANLPSAA